MPTAQSPSPIPIEEVVPLAAFDLLLNIFQPEASASESGWDKAVPWSCLRSLGLCEPKVQELLASGHLEHRLETTQTDAQSRTFRVPQGTTLTLRSCFVLTLSGFGYAQRLCVRRDGGTVRPLNPPHGEGLTVLLPERPRWDREDGKLWFGGQLLKRFRHPAANQRFLLDTLETAGWPSCIPNPFRLPRTPKPKKRMHQTIESLNEGQRGTPRIRFGGDGQGRLRWEKVI